MCKRYAVGRSPPCDKGAPYSKHILAMAVPAKPLSLGCQSPLLQGSMKPRCLQEHRWLKL